MLTAALDGAFYPVERAASLEAASSWLQNRTAALLLVGACGVPLRAACETLHAHAPQLPLVAWGDVQELADVTVDVEEVVPRDAPAWFVAARIMRVLARVGARDVLVASRTRTRDLERTVQELQEENQRLNMRREMLQGAGEEILSFLAHDLRGQLAVVLGHAEMLQGGLLRPEKRDHAFEAVRSQARRILEASESLLVRGRRALGWVAPEERGDLGDLVREVMLADGVLPRRLGPGLTLTVADPAPVAGALAALRDVIAAVLDALLREVAPGREIAVSVAADAEQVWMAVAGAWARQPEDAFRPEANHPSGLGLAARLASGQGGVLAQDGGASPTIRLVLPRARHADARRTVAFVGDDARLAWAVGGLGIGWEVRALRSEADPLRDARGALPDAVVFDLGDSRPLRRLRALAADAATAQVPLVALVGPGAAPRADVLAAGAHAILEAPVAIADLADTLRCVLAPGRSVLPPRDRLTSVRTRHAFAEAFGHLLPAARSACKPVPLVTVLLPTLPTLVRTHGWEHADEVISWVANALAQRAGAEDVLARSGYDNFIWAPFGAGWEDAHRIVDELRVYFCRVRPRVGSGRTSIDVRLGICDATIVEGGVLHFVDEKVDNLRRGNNVT